MDKAATENAHRAMSVLVLGNTSIRLRMIGGSVTVSVSGSAAGR